MTLRAAAVFIVVLAAACASPIPAPTQTTGPTDMPKITASPSDGPLPSPDPTLHVNGLATLTREGVRIWRDPANGDAGPKKNFIDLAAGSRVLLVDGPLTVAGMDYWQVYPSTRGYTTPLGWVAAAKADGTSNLAPVQLDCLPLDGITAAKLGAIERLELLACFGSDELTLHGTVTCNYVIADGIVAGPMLNSNILCVLDAALALMGAPITDLYAGGYTNPVVNGRYSVVGHFDDPGAQHCYQTPFGTSLNGSRTPGDPGAIQECRLFFVVTSAQELTN